MKQQLGWLTFMLGLGFTVILFITLVGSAWFGLPVESASIGFFGSGLPLIFTGIGTMRLWSGEKQLLNRLGWTATVAGLAFGVCVLVLVAVLIIPGFQSPRPGIGHFVGFGIAGLICGGFGIRILLDNARDQ